MGIINLNSITPAAPAGYLNVTWQAAASNTSPRDVSAYVPNTSPGSVVTTLNDMTGAINITAGPNVTITNNVTAGTIEVSASAGVESLNGETGNLTIAAGTGVAVASGGTTITISAGGGGNGGYPFANFTAPSITGWNWLNQGTASVLNSNGVVTLKDVGIGSDHVRMLYTTLPSAPWTLTAAVLPNVGQFYGTGATGQVGDGLALSNGTAIRTFWFIDNNQLNIQGYSNFTTYQSGANLGSWATYGQWPLIWMHIVDDGITRSYYVSRDPVNVGWILTITEPHAIVTGITCTPNLAGYCIDVFGGNAGVSQHPVLGSTWLSWTLNQWTPTLKADQLSLGAIHQYAMAESSGNVVSDAGSVTSNGTYFGSPTLNNTPSISPDQTGCVLFNGSSQYADLGFKQPPAASSGAAWSIEFVYKPTEPTTNPGGAIGRLMSNDEPSTSGNGFEILGGCCFLSPTVYAQIYVGFSGGTAEITTLFGSQVDQIYLCQLVYTGTGSNLLQWWVNGNLIQQVATSGNYNSGGYNVQVGRMNAASPANYLQCYVANVAFYNFALSATQIADNNEGFYF